MARRSRRLTTLFSLVAVLALASMGLTYTLWSETLEVDGTVNTGTLDVSIGGSYVEKVDAGFGPLDEALYDDGSKVDAANCSVDGEFVGVTGPGENGYDNKLNITVTGGYPSYYCIVTVTVTNDGNVPVHVNQPVQTSGEGIAGLAPFDGYVEGDCYAENVQLHTGDSETCEIVIHFENDDNLNEGATGEYTFSFEILAHQWNEEA